jgi:hypothetical protein
LLATLTQLVRLDISATKISNQGIIDLFSLGPCNRGDSFSSSKLVHLVLRFLPGLSAKALEWIAARSLYLKSLDVTYSGDMRPDKAALVKLFYERAIYVQGLS